MVGNEKFVQAAKLYDFVGNCQLADGRTVRNAFRLIGDISLWDCLSSYLILYKFPLCLFSESKPRFSFREICRPFIGTLSNAYEVRLNRRMMTNVGLVNIPNADKSNRVLFLGFNETQYRDVLKSVYSSIESDKSFDQPIVLTNTEEMSARKGYLSIWDCYGEEVIKSVNLGLALTKTLKIDLLESITSNVDSVPAGFAIDWIALRRELSWLCNREIPRLVYLAGAVKHVLTNVAPSLVVTADDADQRSKVVEFMAKKVCVPTLVVQQGICRAEYPDWLHFTGNYIAAMSSISLETMVEQGVQRHAITVTGHPGHDKLTNRSERDSGSTREELKVSGNSFLAIFASQPYVYGAYTSAEARRRVIREACETISAIKGVQLVVKAHPSDDIYELRRMTNHCHGIQIVDSELEISRLIAACDVFITMFSQTTLEALFANKPVINIDFPNTVVCSPFLSGGATIVAKSCDDLRSEIVKLVSKDSQFFQTEEYISARDEMISNWAYRSDGMATKRVVDLIGNIINIPSVTS